MVMSLLVSSNVFQNAYDTGNAVIPLLAKCVVDIESTIYLSRHWIFHKFAIYVDWSWRVIGFTHARLLLRESLVVWDAI